MLVIITTHPIQYQVPLWRKLAEDKNIEFEVWYLTEFGIKESFDVEFGKSFAWDLPSLEGYKYRFLQVNEGALPNIGFRGIRIKEDLKKLFHEYGVTHVYINGWQVQAYWQALWKAKNAGLTVLFKGESNDLKPETGWKWPIKKRLLSAFFSKVDYFLCIGSANRRLYKKHGVEDKKLLNGLYCVDNERFRKSSYDILPHKEEIKKTWGIPKDSYCFLFAGKFIDKKRPLDIIRAAELLNNPSIHLLFVGAGELYNEIRSNCNVVFDNGQYVAPISKKVSASIIGFLNQTEMPRAYAVSDCLILPSNYNETWGLVVNEAMACGLPAIISDQCGSAEDLAYPLDKNLVFECKSPTSLASSMDYVMKNSPSKKSILRHIKKFDYQSTIDSLKNVIK